MPFLYHKRPETAFFHTFRHPLFLTLLFQKNIIYFISAGYEKYSLHQGLHGFRALMDTLIF